MAWKLLTEGDVPYDHIGSNDDVLERVCAGERLACPSSCPDALWMLPQHTWAESPAERPSFTEIAGEIAHMRQDRAEEEDLLKITIGTLQRNTP